MDDIYLLNGRIRENLNHSKFLYKFISSYKIEMIYDWGTNHNPLPKGFQWNPYKIETYNIISRKLKKHEVVKYKLLGLI